MTISEFPQSASPEATPTGQRRVLLVVNPVAGRPRNCGRYKAVRDALRHRGCKVKVKKTKRPGHAKKVAAKKGKRSKYDVIAVAGGDGTINEVLNGLRPDAPPLAVIPLGTANVLALEIGIDPADVEGIARTIAECEPSEVYVGIANERRFVMMAGVGFDAAVVAGVDSDLKKRAGKGAYVWQTLVEMMRYTYPRFVVEADGERHEAASVVIANGHYYGGPLVCAPDARLDQPWLDVCLFLKGGRLATLRYAISLLMGRLPKRRDVRLLRARHVTVRGPEGAVVQGDGDLIASLPLTVEICSAPIEVLAPALEPIATLPEARQA